MSGSQRESFAGRRVIGLVFVGAAFLFLGLFIARNAGDLRAHTWTVRPGLLALSLLLHIVGLAWGVKVWQLLLGRMGATVGFLDLARIWFVSGLGRYIPGKIWQFVGAAHLGAGAGLPATVTVTSLAAHTGFFLVGAAFAAVYLLPPVDFLMTPVLTVLRWVAPLALLLVHPRVIDSGLAVVRRTTGRELESWRGRWVDGLVLVLFSGVGWILTGAALFLFIASLTPIALSALPSIVAFNALAFVVGYLVFIAPAGLGAKEGALAVLLSIYVPAPVAALLAIATRFWTVAAEILPALLLLLRGRQGPRASPSVISAAPERRT